METLDRLLAGGQDLVAILDDLVGGQPSVGMSEVHRAASGMKPEPYLPRGLHLGGEEVPDPLREHVVVVHGGRAAGADEGSEPGAGGGPLDLLVHVRPYRVQLDEPLKKSGLLRYPAGGPLVEVVVAVDEPRRRQAPSAVEAPRLLADIFGCGTAAHGDDAVPLDDDVAALMLGPGSVDRGDAATFYDDARGIHAELILSAARRTASRIFS